MRSRLVFVAALAGLIGAPNPPAVGRDLSPAPPPAAFQVDVARFEARDPGGAMRLDGLGEYRGVLELRRGPAGVGAVNELDLEAYLKGIAEMPNRWPAEALRAQAIAARSYALWVLESGRAGSAGDLAAQICATEGCQVYAGLAKEQAPGGENWAAAVEATRGQVLLYRGRPIQAKYSSSNGGRSVAGGRPYLQSVDDPDDARSPLHRWTLDLSFADLGAALATPGPVTGVSRAANGDVVVTWREGGVADSAGPPGGTPPDPPEGAESPEAGPGGAPDAAPVPAGDGGEATPEPEPGGDSAPAPEPPDSGPGPSEPEPGSPEPPDSGPGPSEPEPGPPDPPEPLAPSALALASSPAGPAGGPGNPSGTPPGGTDAEPAGGQVVVTPAAFRTGLNATVPPPVGRSQTVPSPMFTLTVDGSTLHVAGRGYGHGIGMSQWGAYGKALRGMKAPAILASYYGGLTPTTPAPGQLPSGLRVAVEPGQDELSVSAAGPFRMADGEGRVVAEVGTGTWRVSPAGQGVRVVPPAGQTGVPVLDVGGLDPSGPRAGEPATLRFRTTVPALVSVTARPPGGQPGELQPAQPAGTEELSVLLPPARRAGPYLIWLRADAGHGRSATQALMPRVADPAGTPSAKWAPPGSIPGGPLAARVAGAAPDDGAAAVAAAGPSGVAPWSPLAVLTAGAAVAAFGWRRRRHRTTAAPAEKGQ